MNFVAVKSVEQQDMQAVHHVRELLVPLRTALFNQARGLLGERGRPKHSSARCRRYGALAKARSPT
jgi:transposase